jgi:hypothetical protein
MNDQSKKSTLFRATVVYVPYQPNKNLGLRIRDVYPGSEFFHPGSRIKKVKEVKYF